MQRLSFWTITVKIKIRGKSKWHRFFFTPQTGQFAREICPVIKEFVFVPSYRFLLVQQQKRRFRFVMKHGITNQHSTHNHEKRRSAMQFSPQTSENSSPCPKTEKARHGSTKGRRHTEYEDKAAFHHFIISRRENEIGKNQLKDY